MNFIGAILDIVFPLKCVSCGERDSDLCIKCLTESPEAERESKPWIFPLFDYRHPPIKKAISLLKYKNKKRIALAFGDVMYGRILEELAELRLMENFREPLLIPIPLSNKRQRERGYNQAELIAKKIIELDKSNNQHKNFELEKNVLIKIKETKHQAHIENRKERLENLIDSFGVKNPERIKSRNIILIDDVTTTGATLEEAKKTLRNAGAKKVIAFIVAH